jgi:hypothetical protein
MRNSRSRPLADCIWCPSFNCTERLVGDGYRTDWLRHPLIQSLCGRTCSLHSEPTRTPRGERSGFNTIDVEDSEIGERGQCGLYPQWSDKGYRSGRVATSRCTRRTRARRRSGFERSQARGSRCSEVSCRLRSGGDHASELPGLYPRVDEERDRRYPMITGSGRTACSA